jgi:hypothetical protein
VVGVRGKALFFAGKLFRAALGRTARLLLEPRPQAVLPVANRSNVAAAVASGIRAGRKFHDAEVYPLQVGGFYRGGFSRLAAGSQVESALLVDQIGVWTGYGQNYDIAK